MARGKTPRALLAQKQDRLDWKRFGFLENLLIFCAKERRSVPPESRVKFGISSKIKDEGVCVLFGIDRERDPLMRGRGVARPDYLVLYASRERCLVTIIEMKGTDRHKLEHGIDQIKALRDRLREEIEAHLPGACRGMIKFQGILLTPFNADIPRAKIQREAASGFTILPLQYGQKAELYRYVRTELRSTDRYVHEKLPRDADELNFIEKILVHAALPERIQGALPAAKLGSGIDVHYAHPDDGHDEDHAALIADRTGALIATPARCAGFRRKIEDELRHLGLRYARLQFTSVP
ncbi:hypothetical protein [Sorangium sp. So ce394]|uniref:hypothetical protein n=1 Tax=Sorangium sp. So ce394 TaxID=3133310 RepID=UPI003F5AF50C